MVDWDTFSRLRLLINHQDVAPGSGDSPGIANASQEPDGVSEETDEESEASAGVGSTGAIDRIEEDFNRSEEARNTGFMGKNSEITWLQRLRQENQFGSPDGPDSEAEFRAKTGGASPSMKVARLGAENSKPCLTPLKGSQYMNRATTLMISPYRLPRQSIVMKFHLEKRQIYYSMLISSPFILPFPSLAKLPSPHNTKSSSRARPPIRVNDGSLF